MEQEKKENEQSDLSLEQIDTSEVRNQDLKETPSNNKKIIKVALYLILAFGGWALYSFQVGFTSNKWDDLIIWPAIPAYFIIKLHRGGFDKIGWIYTIFLGLSVPIISFLALIAYFPIGYALGSSPYNAIKAIFIIFIGIEIVQKIRKNNLTGKVKNNLNLIKADPKGTISNFFSYWKEATFCAVSCWLLVLIIGVIYSFFNLADKNLHIYIKPIINNIIESNPPFIILFLIFGFHFGIKLIDKGSKILPTFIIYLSCFLVFFFYFTMYVSYADSVTPILYCFVSFVLYLISIPIIILIYKKKSITLFLKIILVISFVIGGGEAYYIWLKNKNFPFCIDSDTSSLNEKHIKGYILIDGIKYSDYCSDPPLNNLRQYYCTDNGGDWKIRDIECPKGCEDGACIK